MLSAVFIDSLLSEKQERERVIVQQKDRLKAELVQLVSGAETSWTSSTLLMTFHCLFCGLQLCSRRSMRTEMANSGAVHRIETNSGHLDPNNDEHDTLFVQFFRPPAWALFYLVPFCKQSPRHDRR